MKNKSTNNVKTPSTVNDVLVALALTTIIILFFIVVYHYFGGSKKLDTNITSFFGAILAFSGMLTKQYFFKETIDYLAKWFQIEKLIDDINSDTEPVGVELKRLEQELSEQSTQAASYAAYVKRELKIIPLIPILLVFLYGAALIACDSVLFRAICLSLMLFLVSYLAKATISSNNLAIEKPILEEMIIELQDLHQLINKDHTEQTGPVDALPKKSS